MNRKGPTPKELWGPVAAIATGAVLLLGRLDVPSLSWDEILYTQIQRRPLAEVIPQTQRYDTNPPLYHLSGHFWANLGGDSDFLVRFLPAFLAVLAFALTYRLAQDLLGGRAGFLTVGMLVLSPFYHLYAPMNRYYALATVLALLQVWLFWKWWHHRGAFWWGCVLTTAALAYTNYLLLTLPAAEGLLLLILARRRRATAWGPWLLGLALAGVLFLPWLLGLPTTLTRFRQWIPADLAGRPLGLLLDVAHPLFAFVVGETLFPWEPLAVVGSVAGGVALLSAFMALWRSRRGPHQEGLLLAALLWLVPLAGSVFLSAALTPTLTLFGIANRTLFALPFFLAFLGTGLAALPRRAFFGVLGLLFLANLLGLAHLFQGYHYHNPLYAVPTRQAVAELSAELAPGDLVIQEDDSGFRYYLEKAGVVPPVVDAKIEVVERALRALPPRVWMVRLGRDRTRLVSEASAVLDLLQARGYQIVEGRGYQAQDPTLRAVKERLLGREAYRYKLEVVRLQP